MDKLVINIIKNNVSINVILNNLKLIIFVIFILFSCRSTNDTISNGAAVVKISLSGSVFESSGNLGTKALLNRNAPYKDHLLQREVIPINDELVLVAELSPVNILTDVVKESSKRALAAVTEQTELKSGIRYKVVVYDTNGSYITERNYIRGQEASVEAIELNGGSSYTFIAYSVNNENILPEITFADAPAKNLSGSHLKAISGDFDFMYFRKDMVVSGDQINYLSIVLKHKFSQITTTFDSSLTGHNVKDLNVGFDSHYPEAEIQLSEGSIVRSGLLANAPVFFPDLDAMIVKSNPVILNADTKTGSLIISSITIGDVVKTNLVPLKNMVIAPGVKYSLKLSFKPNDTIIINEGPPAVKIDGMVWLQHDLGADSSISTDQDTPVAGLHGNLYQWGRSVAVAGIHTDPGIITGWNTVEVADDKQWNSGTEQNPVKTDSDPCPQGFRIPTTAEYRRLINATDPVSSGNWKDVSTNYEAGIILYSKTNKNVRLLFPMSGRRRFSNGALEARGTFGAYWTSSPKGSNLQMYDLSASGNLNFLFFNTVPTFGQMIRCVGE